MRWQDNVPDDLDDSSSSVCWPQGHHGWHAHDHGHSSPSDSLSSLSDRGRCSERHKGWHDHRSSQCHSHSAQMCRSTRERSIPSHTPSYNEWHHEDNTHEDQYKAELLCCYQGLIHVWVGHEHEALPDIRVSPLEKYSGKDDIKVFDTWLNGLLCWFQVYNVTGGHKDSMRVDPCGTTLTGLAATWYGRWSWGLELKDQEMVFWGPHLQHV